MSDDLAAARDALIAAGLTEDEADRLANAPPQQLQTACATWRDIAAMCRAAGAPSLAAGMVRAGLSVQAAAAMLRMNLNSQLRLSPAALTGLTLNLSAIAHYRNPHA